MEPYSENQNEDSGVERPTGQPQAEGQAGPGKSNKRTIIIAVAAVAIVVLCCICLAVVGLVAWRTDLLSFLSAKQAVPSLMPANTAFYASVKTDIRDLEGFKHLADVYGDLPEFEEAWEGFLDEMESGTEISFEEDILSWLGPEVAIGFTDVDWITQGDQPTLILAAQTTNTKASDAFLEKLREQLEDDGYNVDEETYKNVRYYVQNVDSEWDTPIVFGTVKKFVILAMDEGVMQEVIDAAQDKSETLAKAQGYTELMGALPKDAVAYVFLDAAGMMDAMVESLGDEGIDLPRETVEQLEGFQALGLAVGVDKEGVQIDFAAVFEVDALSPETLDSLATKPSAHRILNQIPSDAVAFISGQNLAAGWKNLVANVRENPDAREQLDDIADELGIQVDEELLSWLSGEFAIALIEASAMGGDISFGAYGISEVSDLELAQATLQEIADALGELLFFEFEEQSISGVEMQVLIEPYEEEILFGYGFADKHLILGFTEDALEQAVADDVKPIADDEVFKVVKGRLPSQTSSYIYINVEAGRRLLYKSLDEWDREDFDETVGPFLKPVVALGMAASPVDKSKGVTRSTLFIYIP